ncbi:MAG: LuxR C-terminal-related transcriptional regulator [Phototrophicaceae bacterium]
MSIPPVTSPTFDLTEREIEILELLNDGMKNQEIANRTGLTLYTIKWYLKQIYSKLYVKNRTQAASKARELGLFSEDVKRSTRTLAAIRTTLPETLTPFFGRADELTHIRTLLLSDDARLITLHGIGGMGKTRLALEAAHQYQAYFTNGAVFVPLASIQHNPLIALLSTLSMNTSDDDPVQQLSAYLSGKQMLIVFDNFEHLLSYAKQLSDLLEQTQDIHIIVTSREVLNLRGETVIALTGLDNVSDAIAIDERAAYQLYVQRAALGLVDFAPDTNEKTFISKICDLVGGMPLAIEMAAGWASVMSVEETYRRMRVNLDMLATNENDRPERHQSIRATFDYSLDLLHPALKRALILLGVFHTEGFPLAAAEAVAGLNPMDTKHLIQTALLQRKANGRFSFHPLIRQYINEHLLQDSDLYQQAQQAHGEYYLQFSEYLIEQLYVDMKLKMLDTFHADAGNLWQAWLYALEQAYYDWLLIATEVGYIAEMAGLWREAKMLYARTLLAIPEHQTLLRGRLRAIQSIFAMRLYEFDTLEHYARESWALLQDSEYIWDGYTAMSFLAITKVMVGDVDECFAILDMIEAIDIPSKIKPNAYVDSVVAVARPAALLFAGRYEEALPLLEKANIPVWSEAAIYLPECYLLLNMDDQAHAAFVRLFTIALDNHNHRLALMTSFYLAMFDAVDNDIPTAIRNNFIELKNMGFQYPLLVRSGHYYGTMLMMRGLDHWGRLLWHSTVVMLHKLGESVMMYQLILKIAQTIRDYSSEDAAILLTALAYDPNCPPPIQQAAIKSHYDRTHISTPTPSHILPILDDVLLGEKS